MSDDEDDEDDDSGLSKEDRSKLEEEFRSIVEEHQIEIDLKLSEASKALAEAEALSEKYGIPFDSSVSRLGQGYTPVSFQDKFAALNREFVYEVCGASTDNYSEGWQHSAVC